MTIQNKYINIIYYYIYIIYNIYIIKIVVNFFSTIQQTVYCLFVCLRLLTEILRLRLHYHTEEVDTLPWESLTLFLRTLTLTLEKLTLTNCQLSTVKTLTEI